MGKRRAGGHGRSVGEHKQSTPNLSQHTTKKTTPQQKKPGGRFQHFITRELNTIKGSITFSFCYHSQIPERSAPLWRQNHVHRAHLFHLKVPPPLFLCVSVCVCVCVVFDKVGCHGSARTNTDTNTRPKNERMLEQCTKLRWWIGDSTEAATEVAIFKVTLPPEMSRIATRSLFGYSHFPKGGGGGAMYRFWRLFKKISFSSLFYIRKNTIVTHTHTQKLISVISKCLKQATLR